MNDLYSLSLKDMQSQAQESLSKTRQDMESLNSLVAEQLNGMTEKSLKSEMNLCLCCSIICLVYSLVIFLRGYYPIAGIISLVLSPLAGLYMFLRIRKCLNGYKSIFDARNYLNSGIQALDKQLSMLGDDLRQYSIADTSGYRLKLGEKESVFARLSRIETDLSQFKACGSPFDTNTGKNLVVLSAAVISIAGVWGFLPTACELLQAAVDYFLVDTQLGEWALYLNIIAAVLSLVLIFLISKKLWSKFNCRVTGSFVMCIPFSVLLYPVTMVLLLVLVALGFIAIGIAVVIAVLAFIWGMLGG